MRRYAYWFALAATIIASLYLLFGPIYSGRSSTIGADGSMVESVQPSRSLWDVNGSRALVAVAIPVLLVVLPMLIRDPYYKHHAMIGAGVLMWGVVLLGLFSIGMYYAPAAVALLLSATAKREAPSS
jgi:hypothetical protein